MENRKQVKNRLTSLAVTSLLAFIMVLSGLFVPLNQLGLTDVYAAASVDSWDALKAAVSRGESEITLSESFPYDGESIKINKEVTIKGSKTIYSANLNKYDSMFKVVSGGKLTIDNGVTLSAKIDNGQTCPDGTTYTAAKFNGGGYDGGATTYQPKGFFIHVEEGGSATLNGTVSDFVTSRDKGTTPKYVAPIVANGSGATFNLGSTGVIKNNLVGYIVNDSKANDDAQSIKMYVKGGPPNSLRVPNANEQKKDSGKYQRTRGMDAGIDGGSPGTGITATAGAVIYKDGAQGTIEGSIDNNRGDTGGIMASGEGTVVKVEDANITRNVGVQFGGGSTTEQGAVIAMTSGTMKYNVAWFGGGAVFATENGVDWLLGKMVEADGTPSFDKRKDGVFSMAGGELTENTGFTRAGAILVDSDGVAVTAGKLTNNMSRMLGGAVYVMGDHPLYTYTMVIDPVYVHDNLAVSGQDRAREFGSSDGVGQNAPGTDMKPKSELDAANELLQRNFRPADSCADVGDTDLFAGQGTFSKNSDDSTDGKGNDGTGGGVWLCPYGAVNFDAAQVSNVVIDNNYATGTLNNIPGSADAKFNSPGSTISRSGIAAGSDFHADAGKQGGGVTIKDLTGSGWKNENTGNDYTIEVNSSRINLISTRELDPNVDVTRLPEDKRVEVSGNISRRGGGLAADGKFYFGEVPSTATASGKMTVTKVWSAVAEQQPIAIRISAEKEGREIVIADVPLDGVANEPIGGEFDTVKELAPNGFTWTGEFSLPLTITDDDGNSIDLYELWYDGEKIDINSIVGREKLGGIIKNRNEQDVEVKAASGVSIKYSEIETTTDENGNVIVKTDEDGNVTEYTTHRFTPGSVNLTDLDYDVTRDEVTQQVVNPETGEIEEKVAVGVYTFGVPLKVEAGNDNDAIVEKYVNKDVHSDIVNFDQVFTYDIMAYVPVTATEFTISDKLVPGLEFADKDGKASTDPWKVVDAVAVKYLNNHEPGEDGTVVSGAIVKTPSGTPIDFIKWEKGWPAGQGYPDAWVNAWPNQGYGPQMSIDGDTLTVKIDELGKDNGGNNPFDLQQARGRWVQVTFFARIKDEYRNLDALEELQNSWANSDSDKNSEDAHDVSFANGDLLYKDGLLALIGPDPIVWAVEAPSRLFARSSRGDYYVTTDGKEGKSWELIAEGSADWTNANNRYTGQGSDAANTIRALDINGKDKNLVAPLNEMPRVKGAEVIKGAEGTTRIFLEVKNVEGEKEIWYTDDKQKAASWTKAEPNTEPYNNGVARLSNDKLTIRMLDFKSGNIVLSKDGKNWPVISEEEHEGMKNQAGYNVKFGNNAEGNYKSNIVTVKPETTELDVVKKWEPDNKWPDDVNSVTFNIYSKKGGVEKQVYVDSEGRIVGAFADNETTPEGSEALTVVLREDDPDTDADESKAKVEGLPKLIGTIYLARETKISYLDGNEEKTVDVVYTDDAKKIGATKLGEAEDAATVVSSSKTTYKGDGAKLRKIADKGPVRGAVADNRLWAIALNGDYYFTEEGDTDGTTQWRNIDKPAVDADPESDPVKNYARAKELLGEIGVKPETIDGATQFEVTRIFTATNSVATTEKYVNNDVHADLGEFDREFKYDIMVFVPEGSTHLTITDTLNDAIEFVGKGDSGSPITSVVYKAKNDHTADSTVAGKDEDNPGTAIDEDEYEDKTEANTLKLVFEGKDDPDNDGMKLPLEFAGKWVQVTFWAKYTDEVIAAADAGTLTDITDNGPVISDKYPSKTDDNLDNYVAHNGTLNNATATIKVNNTAEFDVKTNDVTVKAETTELEVSKKWNGGDNWPGDAEVTIGLLKKKADGSVEAVKGTIAADGKFTGSADDTATQATYKLNKDKKTVTITGLPKLIGTTYLAEEKKVGNVDLENNVFTLNGVSYISEAKHEKVTDDDSDTYKTTFNNTKIETEKYVNNDVHADLVQFDKAFKYDIMVYVPAGSTHLTITDPLKKDVLEFAKKMDSIEAAKDAAAEKTTNPAETIASVVYKDTNDHTANSSVAEEGTAIAADDYTASIENNTLTLSFVGADTDEADIKEPLAFAGKWVQVTFWAKYTDEIIAAADAGTLKDITDNGPVISEEYPSKADSDDEDYVAHSGTENQATSKIRVNNESEFEIKTNEVTVKAEDEYVWVQKKLVGRDGETMPWPAGLVVNIAVNRKIGDDVKTVQTIKVTSAKKYKSKKFPKLIGATYTADEVTVPDNYEKISVTGNGTEDSPFVITNKDNRVDVEVTKIWENATMDEIPSAEDFKSMLVLRNSDGEDVSGQHLNKLKVTANGRRYTATWSNLPNDEYTVDELDVPGFGKSFDGETITNTKKPEEEKPEIEKYVNQAVHKDIVLDEVFTYDIIAYITKDADSVRITDTLNDVLTFESDAKDIKVVDLGESDNHLVTNNVHAEKVNNNASVAENGTPIDDAKVTIDGQTLEVFITNKLKPTTKSYNAVVIDNPKEKGYLEKDGEEYVPTNDEVAEEGKDYYAESGYEEADVALGDDVSGLFVLDDNDEYVEMQDATAEADTTYYKIAYEKTPVAVINPSASGYYEKSGNKYILTEDNVADPGKTYYEESDVEDSNAGYEYDGDEQPVTALRGHWVKVTFDARVKDGMKLADVKKAFAEINSDQQEERAEDNIGNAPVVSTEDHVGVPNNASYTIGVANEARIEEDVYGDKSNTVTVKPLEEKPEIEKFINQAVHNDIDLSDVFTYDVVAYITKDANTATITDELDKQLQFVSGAGDVRVEDLGIYNNHKVTNNIKATQVNDDATVNDPGEEIANCEVTISGRKLTVKLNDCANSDQPLRGHWVRVTFQCKIADGLTLDDLKFTDINPKAIEDREAPNVGNDPVLSDEAHKGVPNKASYTIDALGDVKYSDTSNTVTVKPVTDREGDYGPEGDEDEGDVKDKDDNTGKVKGKGTRTGDETRVVLWIMSLILTMALATVLGLKKRMQRR